MREGVEKFTNPEGSPQEEYRRLYRELRAVDMELWGEAPGFKELIEKRRTEFTTAGVSPQETEGNLSKSVKKELGDRATKLERELSDEDARRIRREASEDLRVIRRRAP